MLASALYFIAIFPFELEVELCVEKLVTGTDFSYLSTFTALALEGFLLKKLFLLAEAYHTTHRYLPNLQDRRVGGFTLK
jgi:hypothetical protein